MYCLKCGALVPDSDAFCSVCGQAVSREPQTGGSANTGITGDEARGERKSAPGFKPLYAVIAAALVIVIAGVIFKDRIFPGETPYQRIMAEAERAEASGDLDLASLLYREALTEKPGDQTALGLLNAALSEMLKRGFEDAKALVGSGRLDDAIKTLSELPITRGDEQYGEYRDYLNALKSRPYLTLVDASQFPEIFICITTENDDVEIDGIPVTDSGKSVYAGRTGSGGRAWLFKYTAEESPDGGEHREVEIDLTISGFSFPFHGSYVTPELQAASVTLVSTDFSDYPTVRAFFRIKDVLTEGHIADISPDLFSISESVSGGAYVAREVKSAEPMTSAGGKYGINISLVADKSDSIGGDMAKIKTVMQEFVGSLALSGGDRAELIAFDDVPQLMCTFTDDASLLMGGINNMAIDGATAFYDAVYQGVRNAALQGGAKCVIAFTDGEDNRSWYTAYDVIRFANEKQVPLYIIGVGNKNSSSHDIMKTMAGDTHGRYWYIDDLYDLSEIYTQIYGELLELYVVSYESDGSADTLAERGLEVEVRGGGYKGASSERFTPAKTVSGGGESRYELFVEDVSWEEASARCLERGGHLVTIASKAEEDQIIALAEAHGAKYVWLGAYTSYDSLGSVFGHWITGEDFAYSNWMEGEPSRSDRDGTPEWYLMLWDVSAGGGWCWNDQRNELVSEFPQYKGKLAYVCEYEP